METRFQTNSFIPKSSLDNVVNSEGKIQRSSGSNNSGSSSFFILISFFIFVCSVVSAGIVFSMNKIAIIQKNSAIESLSKSQKDINKDTIEELKALNNRLAIINSLINNHVAVSHIFAELGKSTIKEVSYSSFSLVKNPDKSFSVSLSAQGVGYVSVIAQDDLLTSAESQKFFKNTSITNFSKSKGEDIASFGVQATISENSLNFSEVLNNNQ